MNISRPKLGSGVLTRFGEVRECLQYNGLQNRVLIIQTPILQPHVPVYNYSIVGSKTLS